MRSGGARAGRARGVSAVRGGGAGRGGAAPPSWARGGERRRRRRRLCQGQVRRPGPRSAPRQAACSPSLLRATSCRRARSSAAPGRWPSCCGWRLLGRWLGVRVRRPGAGGGCGERCPPAALESDRSAGGAGREERAGPSGRALPQLPLRGCWATLSFVPALLVAQGGY